MTDRAAWSLGAGNVATVGANVALTVSELLYSGRDGDDPLVGALREELQ